MITLHGFQLNKTPNSQPLFVELSLINHAVNMLGEDLSRLQKNGLISRLKLFIDGKGTLNRSGGNNFFDGCSWSHLENRKGPCAAEPSGTIASFLLVGTFEFQWCNSIIRIISGIGIPTSQRRIGMICSFRV